MPTIEDVNSIVIQEFGKRLEPLGFEKVDVKRWVRSAKIPIREIFRVGAIKGAQYSPVWGISTGIIPRFDRGTFRKQSTDKNCVMDLVIDPIDHTGNAPPEAFSFIAGANSTIPVGKIAACAAHFVPVALRDFQRVTTVEDFCQFFRERSTREYRRFTFDMYVQHQLAAGFVDLLEGKHQEGLKKIRLFCAQEEADVEDKILLGAIKEATTLSGGPL